MVRDRYTPIAMSRWDSLFSGLNCSLGFKRVK